MSGKQQSSWRAARPAFFGLIETKKEPKNIINDQHKRFAKSALGKVKPHLKQHYNMLREYAGEAPSISDLIHFHVYGEYRLFLEAGNTVTRPRTHDYPHFSPINPQQYLEEGKSLMRRRVAYGSHASQYTIHGIKASQRFDAGKITTRGNLKPINVPFFDSLIQSSSPGRMFFLPSIGTMFLSVSSYTKAWPIDLRQYFGGKSKKEEGGRIPELFRKVVQFRDNDVSQRLRSGDRDLFRAPWFEDDFAGTSDAFLRVWEQAGFDKAAPPRDKNGAICEVNLFFVSWVSTFLDSVESKSLSNEIKTELSQAAIAATFSTRKEGLTKSEYDSLMNFGGPSVPNRYENADSMNIYGACAEFFSYMETDAIKGTISDKNKGKLFAFDTTSEVYDRLFSQNVNHDGKDLPAGVLEWIPHFDQEDGAYNSAGAWQVANTTNTNVTIQQTAQELEYEEDNPIPIGWLEGDENAVTRSITLPIGALGTYLQPCDENGVIIETDEDVEEGLVVATDANASLAYVSRVLVDCYFEMETYLLLSVNSNNINFKRFSSEQKEDDASLSADYFQQSSGKKKFKVGDFLAEQRANLMEGYLASLLAHTRDEGLRTLYDGELMISEIDWYTKTISSRLLAATSAPQVQSPLAIRQFPSLPKPYPANVSPLGIVQAETILRTLDVPTLRVIMEEYFDSFYTSISSRAKALDDKPTKGKKKKNKKLLIEQMWDTVDSTVATIVSLPDVRSHQLWSVTFDAVESARAKTSERSTPVMPPSWAGRFFKSDLIRDRRLTGQPENKEESVILLKNYIGFLKSAYSKNYSLVGQLLGSFQKIAARSIVDIDELQQFFTARLKNDEKFELRGERFNAFRQFIYICRTFLSMPVYEAALAMAEKRDALTSSAREDPTIAPELESTGPLSPVMVDTQGSFQDIKVNPKSLLRPDGGA